MSENTHTDATAFLTMLDAAARYQDAKTDLARLEQVGAGAVRLSAAAEEETEALYAYYHAFRAAVQETQSRPE
jgi:hypothetical protein